MENNTEQIIGVIGAGVMGSGVAQRLATYGYRVQLVDIHQEVLDKSMMTIKRNLLIYNMMHKEKRGVEAILDRITTDVNDESLAQVDMIIENVPEVIETKKAVYKRLNQICKKTCYYLVNTSCIPITQIGSFLSTPERVIGVHFMNPVPMQTFAEVIQGYYTSEATITTVQDFLELIGIHSTVIQDSTGFVTNRLSHIFMNEAANLVLEGVATPEQIDEIFMKGFHHKMGPLHTADLIGLDTVVQSLQVLYDAYQDSKYRCSPQLKKMVHAGLLGRKSGQGFFSY